MAAVATTATTTASVISILRLVVQFSLLSFVESTRRCRKISFLVLPLQPFSHDEGFNIPRQTATGGEEGFGPTSSGAIPKKQEARSPVATRHLLDQK